METARCQTIGLVSSRTPLDTYRSIPGHHQSLGGLTHGAYAAHWQAHQCQPEHPYTWTHNRVPSEGFGGYVTVLCGGCGG